MIYAYRCRSCGHTEDHTRRGLTPPCPCGSHLRRDFHVNITPSAFTPHFNNAVGAYVHTPRDFADKLKEKSDAQSAATGIDHNYTRLDPGDMPRPTQGDGIFDTQAKAWRDRRAV